MKDIVFGVLGGIVGAGVWAGVAYATDYEIGWIAWGIGALVGYAVAFGNRDHGRSPTAAGVIAVAVTVLSIVGGKYAAVELLMPSDHELMELFTAEFDNEEYVVSFLADEIVEEYEAAGLPMAWPEGADRTSPTTEGDYPVEVWTEASARWAAWSEAERTGFRDEKESEVREEIESSLPEIRAMLGRGGLVGSFSPMDLLFFGLGTVTAWGVARGGRSPEEVEVAYRIALLASMLRVTAADGVIEAREIASIRSVLEEALGEEADPAVIRAEAEKLGTDATELLTALHDLAPHLDSAQREKVVRSAVQIAVSDGSFGPGERALIEDAADALGLSEADLRGILTEILSRG